jgi:hypothetical protein
MATDITIGDADEAFIRYVATPTSTATFDQLRLAAEIVAEKLDAARARPALPLRYCATCGHRQRDTTVFHFPGCPALGIVPVDDYIDPSPVGTVYDAPGDRPPDPEHIADALRADRHDADPYDPGRGAGF